MTPIVRAKTTTPRIRSDTWYLLAVVAIATTVCADEIDILNDRVIALLQAGKNAEAIPLAEDALDRGKKRHGTRSAQAATLMANLAAAYREAGGLIRLEASIRLSAEALEIVQTFYGRESLKAALFHNTLAECHHRLSDYQNAELHFKRALEIRKTSQNPTANEKLDISNEQRCLGIVYAARGDLALAAPLLQEAYDYQRLTLGIQSNVTITSLNALANLRQLQGQGDAAEALYKEALSVHPEHPYLLNNLAWLYVSQGRLEAAESLYRHAIRIFETELGRQNNNTVTVIDNLGLVLIDRGNFEAARPLVEEALASRKQNLGSDGEFTAYSYNNVGMTYAGLGRHDDAERMYRRAVAVNETIRGHDHPETVRNLSNLVKLSGARRRWTEAAEAADQMSRRMRRHVAGVLAALAPDEQRNFLVNRHRPDFAMALSLGLNDAALAAVTGGWLANGKGVAQEAAARQAILARRSQDAAVGSLVMELDRVRNRLARLAQEVPAGAEAASHRATLESLRTKERSLVHGIGGQLALIDRDEPWVEIDAIRRNIPVDSVLVDIARFGIFDFAAAAGANRWQPARYVAWIVPPAGRGDVAIVDLGEAEAIDAAVETYRGAIQSVQNGGFARGQDTAEKELLITAAPLTRKVLQPIVDAVGLATEIVLSPDGALWLVPWQALPLADGSYAIEKFSMRTVTSARELVPVPVDAKGGTGTSVVLADPAFDAAPVAGGPSAGGSSRSLAPSQDLVRRFLRLANTRGEALATKPAIARLTGGEPTIFLGSAATEANFKRAAVRPRTVVLATHGFFMNDQDVRQSDAGSMAGGRDAPRAVTTAGLPLEDPLLRCGLAFAGANVAAMTGGDDGILTGAEIVGIDLLGTDMVVLSACETGVGTVHNGEGVAGLRQAFQIAGAKSVVATLWQVPDTESAQIMAAFYANLAKGQSPSQALHNAQLAFIQARREDRNYEAAHPYLWAAYGVTGR